MERPPISFRELSELLEEKVNAHRSLEHKDLIAWKNGWFAAIPYYHMLNHCNKVLISEKSFNLFKRTVSAMKVSHTANWTWFDWLLDAAKSKCTCKGAITEYAIHEDEILQRLVYRLSNSALV